MPKNAPNSTKSAKRCQKVPKNAKNAKKILLYWCYYLHPSKDLVSALCRIFTDSALRAGSVIELQCPSVRMCHRETLTSGGHWDLWSKKVFLILACDDTIFQKKVHDIFSEIVKTRGFGPTSQNTHFPVLWRALVEERIPNIGLWSQNFNFFLLFSSKIVKTRGFGRPLPLIKQNKTNKTKIEAS